MTSPNVILGVLGSAAVVGGGVYLWDRKRKADAAARVPVDQQMAMRNALIQTGKGGCMALGAVYKVPPSASAGVCEGLSTVAYAVGKGALKYTGKGAKAVGKGTVKGAKAVGKGVKKGVKAVGKIFGLGELGELGDDELAGYALASMLPRRSMRGSSPITSAIRGGIVGSVGLRTGRALRLRRRAPGGLSAQARTSVARIARGLGDAGCGGDCGCGPCSVGGRKGMSAKNRTPRSGRQFYAALLGT